MRRRSGGPGTTTVTVGICSAAGAAGGGAASCAPNSAPADDEQRARRRSPRRSIQRRRRSRVGARPAAPAARRCPNVGVLVIHVASLSRPGRCRRRRRAVLSEISHRPQGSFERRMTVHRFARVGASVRRESVAYRRHPRGEHAYRRSLVQPAVELQPCDMQPGHGRSTTGDFDNANASSATAIAALALAAHARWRRSAGARMPMILADGTSSTSAPKGRTTRVPDLATIRAGVVTQGADRRRGAGDNAQRMARGARRAQARRRRAARHRRPRRSASARNIAMPTTSRR